MAVNERGLWVIEDGHRDKDGRGPSTRKFIRLARAVYVENDERAAIKKRIQLEARIHAGRRRNPTGVLGSPARHLIHAAAK